MLDAFLQTLPFALSGAIGGSVGTFLSLRQRTRFVRIKVYRTGWTSDNEGLLDGLFPTGAVVDIPTVDIAVMVEDA